MRRGRLHDERGSATVWMLALSALLGVLAAAVVLVGAAVVARHRATAAADLAALAGAGRAAVGDPDPCEAARRIAAANDGVLDDCIVNSGEVVGVHVHVTVRLGPLGTSKAVARARAGPAPPDSTPG